METVEDQIGRLNLTLQMDGDSWCCVGDGFIDLQQSTSGFGDTKQEAIDDYMLRKEAGL